MQIEIAVPTPLPQTFTYEHSTALEPGTRVLVPFGPRKLIGVVLGNSPPPSEGIEIKAVSSVLDPHPVYSPKMLELARWMSRYYFHPLGEVLRAMLPVSIKKSPQKISWLRADPPDPDSDLLPILADLFGKRKELLEATGKKRLAEIALKMPGMHAADEILRKLVKAGFVTVKKSRKMTTRDQAFVAAPATSSPSAWDFAETLAQEKSFQLSQPQSAAFAELSSMTQDFAVAAPKPFLIFGITGSGKTELYLRAIYQTLTAHPDGQALVLVPEISLTPQMTQVFERRFPGMISVVHSAMADETRWLQLERVRHGQAKILIGPRSAVFAPFHNLRLLIVDEEHDNSYKQANGLTYNGRDVAVMRGHLEKSTVILGSATPSMESFYNALSGKYVLLELKERARAQSLPEIVTIQAKSSHNNVALFTNAPASSIWPKEIECANISIDPFIIDALKENLADKKQAIVLVNRRGYAFYLLSLKARKAVTCPQCSISLTLHKKSSSLCCHYCDYSLRLVDLVAKFPDDRFIAIGYGSEKAEDTLRHVLPDARIARLDSDVVARREALPEMLDAFRRHEIDILVGTQILAKGHDFPKVTLIVILEVDQLLDLPDFRAGERTFQLIVQAAGRAGRAEHPGKVIVQCLRSQHPVIQTALRQDYAAFASLEMRFRKDHAYPPFSRMIAIELNSTDPSKLDSFCLRVEKWLETMFDLEPALLERIRVLGPAAPPIETVRGRHRRSLLLSSAQTEALRDFAGKFFGVFQKLPGDMRMTVDVDPQSLI